RWGGLIVRGLGDLVGGFIKDPTAAPPASGPIGIAVSLADILLGAGPVLLLYVAGILSVNLGVVNILPFPPLDGGRMAILVIKRVFGQCTFNNNAAAKAVPDMLRKLHDIGVGVPVIGDFHYNGHQLLVEYPEMAKGLAKYRINPGNVGAKRHDENFQTIVRVAVENDKPVRIGVNWGSLDQALLTDLMDVNAKLPEPRESRDVMIDAMVESAMRSAELAEATGLGPDRIILSAKVSRVRDVVDVYRILAARSDYPLHVGLTEAGLGMKGIVASTAGLSILLEEGIGDTIRVSLTPAPGGEREAEARVAQQVLQAMGLRSFLPQVSACPGCGRTTSTYFQEMAERIQGHLRDRMPDWKSRYPGVEELTVAVMGCVVNGPGESKHANIGIS